MLESLTKDHFSDHLGERFRLDAQSDVALELELIEVKSLPTRETRPPHIRREPFALLFRGSHDEPLAQRIYRIEHPELGVLEIFLVPVGPDGEGMRYEAIFN